MVYNFNLKRIDDVQLKSIEWEVFEQLVKFNGAPIKAPQIRKLINERYPNKDFAENTIRIYIGNINKKANNLISNRYQYGYY